MPQNSHTQNTFLFFNSKDTQNSETEEAGFMQAMAESRPDTVRFKEQSLH